MTVRWRGRHVFDQIGAGLIEGLPQYILGNQYFVSKNDGKDANVGTSPDKPVLTVARATALSNTTIDWAKTPKKRNVIWVEPGVYEENLTPAYYADMVGLGVRGTDTQAEIHVATGSVMAGTLLGCGYHNLWFEGEEAAVPLFDIGICNNSLIRACQFALGANVAGVVAIDTENCTHLTVELCDFESGQLQDLAYAIYARGGADKFFHNCRIRKNNIFAQTCGIYTASDCRADRSLIKKNFIRAMGTGYGVRILDTVAPTCYVVENDIVVIGAGTAIEHTQGAGYTLLNRTLVNGVYAQVTP